MIEHVEPQLQDADVKELPASLLPAVPLPVTLCCLHSVFERGLYLSFDRAVWEALKRRKEVVFGVLEWSALVSASSYERANAASFAGWCEAKAKQPTWKLQLADAIGCVIGETESRDEAQTVGAVLRSWGCTLQRVHYGKDLLT